MAGNLEKNDSLFSSLDNKLAYFEDNFDSMAANAFLIAPDGYRKSGMGITKMIATSCFNFYCNYLSDEEMTFSHFASIASDKFRSFLHNNFNDLSDPKKVEIFKLFNISILEVGKTAGLIEQRKAKTESNSAFVAKDIYDIFEYAYDQQIKQEDTNTSQPNSMADYSSIAVTCAEQYENINDNISSEDYVQKCLNIYINYWSDTFGDKKMGELSLGMMIFENKLRSLLVGKKNNEFQDIEDEVMKISDSIPEAMTELNLLKEKIKTMSRNELIKLNNRLLFVTQSEDFKINNIEIKGKIVLFRAILKTVQDQLMLIQD